MMQRYLPTYLVVLAVCAGTYAVTNYQQAGMFMDRRVYADVAPAVVSDVIFDASTHQHWLRIPEHKLTGAAATSETKIEYRLTPNNGGPAFTASAELQAINGDRLHIALILPLKDRLYAYRFVLQSVGERTVVQMLLSEDLNRTSVLRRLFPHLVLPQLEDVCEDSQAALLRYLEQRDGGTR